jgi:cysteine desulfurase/selenocysteine lyase
MADTNALIAARKDFPALDTHMNGKPLVYLDSASSAQKPQIVIDTMSDILTSGYSNIHRGLYAISQDLTVRFEQSRAKIANFINANADEIVFTRNATEAINLVVQSWGRTFLKQGDEIILSAMEHHANIVPWQILRDQIGIVIKVIPLDDQGALDLEAYKNLLSDKTKFVGCVHISNATGTINNTNKIIKIAKEFNPEIKVLIDGTQSIVHMPVNVKTMDADFFVFTGHKLYGPTGIGGLYGKLEILNAMPPYQGGGDMIERVSWERTTYKEAPSRFEAGTPPIVEVIGLGASVDYLVDKGMDNLVDHENTLMTYAHEKLSQIKGLTLYGDQKNKIGIFSFTMDCAHPSDIAMICDQMGIAVRAGHHCAMPYMQALNTDATVRASLALYNTKQDIDCLIKALEKVRELFS